MKIKLILLLVLFATVTFAQQSFFETLEAHGNDAKYLNFGQVYVNDDGKQQTSNGAPRDCQINILQFNQLPTGLEVLTTFKGEKPKRTNWYDAAKEKVIEFVGFPNTSMVYHGGYNRGYVAIGNYVFFLERIHSNKLDFEEISRAYVLVGSSANQNADKPKKKKKKFGAFLKKVKDAATSGNSDPRYSQPKGPEYDALMSQDVKQMIKDYLVKMKAKQDAYTLTATDKANLATIKNAGKDYDKMVKDKNDAYWRSPEGQAVLRNRRNAKGYASKNEVTIKNNTNNTIYIASSGSRNQGTEITPGQSVSWSCSRDAYFQNKLKKDTNTSYYETTSRKAYSANSNCGGTKTIN